LFSETGTMVTRILMRTNCQHKSVGFVSILFLEEEKMCRKNQLILWEEKYCRSWILFQIQ